VFNNFNVTSQPVEEPILKDGLIEELNQLNEYEGKNNKDPHFLGRGGGQSEIYSSHRLYHKGD